MEFSRSHISVRLPQIECKSLHFLSFLTPLPYSPFLFIQGKSNAYLRFILDSRVLKGSEGSAKICSISLCWFFSSNSNKTQRDQELWKESLSRNDAYPGDRDLLCFDSQKPQHMVLSAEEQDTLIENTV